MAAGVWLRSDEIKSAGATSRSIRTPHYWLGDDLHYDTDRWERRGYVLHVAIPMTKLGPLDRQTGARLRDVEFSEEPAPELHLAHCESTQFLGCDQGCVKMNPECSFEEPRGERGRKRWFVV